MARWVPVEERLPASGTQTLFTDGRGLYCGDFIQGEWYCYEDGYKRLITHWLDPHPLPGEEDEDG